MDNLKKFKISEKDRLPMTIAGNLGNIVGQIELQLAQYQIKVQEDQETIKKLHDLVAEKQNQIDGLRGEKKNG